MFGDNLKKLRKEHGISQKELAEKLFISQQAVAKWESDKASPNPEMVARIAELFGTTTDYLLGREERAVPPGDDVNALISKHPQLFRPKMKKIPLIGGVACGEPIFSPNLDEEFALVNEDIDADYALVCKGDSMIEAGISDGDVIYIRQQEIVDNGQIAAVIIGEEITLKRVFYYQDKNKLVLHPANPNYEPLVYSGLELDEIRILGRAVAQLRRIR